MSVPRESPDPHAETITRTAPNNPLSSEHPDAIPPTLPRIPGYRILRRLGGGGMGDVFEAIDEKLGVAFALKMVRPDRTAVAYAERFRQEVRAMMLLDHPHVARIYRHDEVNGWPYFTMKFVRGGTLADRRHSFVNNPRAAAGLVAKVADAVHYLHERGMIHRDLKPSNILIDENGEPILSDFGLVKDVAIEGELFDAHASIDADTRSSPSRAAEAQTLTRTGGVLGTYAYMSPEQARGQKGAIAPATDVWALGVILYELLAGFRPGEETGNTTSNYSHVDTTSVHEPPGVDPVLAAIVGRCLAERPNDRYSSAALLAADLRHWARSTEPRARQWKPAALLIGSLILLTVLISVAIAKRGSKKDSASEQRAYIQSELRANRSVALIDADGNACNSFRLLGNGSAERESGGWWTVQSTDKVLAVFLDDPGIDAFTLSGEVRANRLETIPSAGLFVGHRQVASADGDWHFQLEYIYNEFPANYRLPPPPPGPAPPLPPKTKSYKANAVIPPANVTGNRVIRLHGTQLSNGPGENPEDLNGWMIGADAPMVGGPWRQMEIRASGTTFTVSWNGVEEHTSRELPVVILDKMQFFLQERPDPSLAFTSRGGLGVYVSGGSASFRNLTIQPGLAP